MVLFIGLWGLYEIICIMFLIQFPAYNKLLINASYHYYYYFSSENCLLKMMEASAQLFKMLNMPRFNTLKI